MPNSDPLAAARAAAGYRAEDSVLDGLRAVAARIDRLERDNARLRASIDQARADMGGMLAFGSDPLMAEMLRNALSALGAV